MEARPVCLFVDAFIFVVTLLLSGSLAQDDCSKHLSSSSGTIQSPNYPNPYPSNIDCSWTVTVEGSVQNIFISFSSFKLQPKTVGGVCTDYVAVYRVLVNKDLREEGRFCGTSLPPDISIEDSSMKIQFKSDAFTSGDTGFSLFYKAQFQDKGPPSGNVSQATAGIVAAVFCAVVFVGVGALRCIMTGACSCCASTDGRAGGNDRQVVGSNESYTFQADFPPSYSTVMEHPERYPTPPPPEHSPQMILDRQRLGTDGSLTPRLSHVFTIQSSDSDTSDNDDNDPPPPPYPGVVSDEDQVSVDAENTADNHEANGGMSNIAVDVDEAESSSPASPAEIQEEHQEPSTSSANQTLVRDSNRDGGEEVPSQANRVYNEGTEGQFGQVDDAQDPSNTVQVVHSPDPLNADNSQVL